MLDFKCFTAFSRKVSTVSFIPPLYNAKTDSVDQKKLSTTLSGVKPHSGASPRMLGGIVLRNAGLGNTIGS